MHRLTYVLPIKRASDSGPPSTEMTTYLRHIAELCQLVVVDGSGPAAFAAAHDAWAGFARHIPPDPDLRCRNGKVHGVLTGLRRAEFEHVVIADDDVRHDIGSLARIDAILDEFDAVVPQNYFDPTPWHAHWDTARTLCNRAFGHDLPGTVGVRRGTLLAAGGYDGDVLFENLELLRTVRAAGGRVTAPLDLYVARRPPTTRHFLSQRVRQAYDELARPWRFAVSLALLPSSAALAKRTPRAIALGAAGIVAVAECGRRRANGRSRYAFVSSLMAPLWTLERAVCAWLALGHRLRGGCPYAGQRLRIAAHPTIPFTRPDLTTTRITQRRSSHGIRSARPAGHPGGAAVPVA